MGMTQYVNFKREREKKLSFFPFKLDALYLKIYCQRKFFAYKQ